MAVNVKGGNDSAGLANVSSTFELNVVTPQTEVDAGFVQISAETDSGIVLGTRTTRAMEVSDDFRVRMGLDQTLFNLSFEGTIVPFAHITQSTSGLSVAQASGFLTLNSGSALTASSYAIVRSHRHFPCFGSYPTYTGIWIREGNPTATNTSSEWGLMHAATTAAPTDGVFFRRLSGGSLRAITNYNGTETEVTIDTTNLTGRDGVGAYDATEGNHYMISYHVDYCRFWINDIAVAEIRCPSNQPSFTSSSNLPIMFRVANPAGGSSAARRVEVGFINIGLGDQNTGKPWSHVMCGTGGGSYQIQPGSTSGGTVFRTGATTGHPASTTARTVGTWTGTSAPAATSLGGLWLMPATASMVTESDYPVFAYLNPVGTPTLPGKTLYITSVRVGEGCVTTVSSNAVIVALFVGVGSTGPTTSVADAAGTVGARTLPLGFHSYSATAAVGTTSPGFEVIFNSPLVVPSGTYFHFIARPIFASASTLTVTSCLMVNGYFE